MHGRSTQGETCAQQRQYNACAQYVTSYRQQRWTARRRQHLKLLLLYCLGTCGNDMLWQMYAKLHY
ncbi:hypothetical protein XMM379_001912 [Aliiroseovarius sp. xm-m-379]|nr:hypothetical protein [Aliiroseovarius sp. xm-m-379]NRP34017.1 hypothetical protein [Aliiroseovarius sp. xm-a-104]NRP50805.1 hypothetical protein [Aliiroseovarius sp. xm-m-354]NRQ05557.1 hypothetical protein [Aliiroseovarius sp. xm-m-309]NRQ08762.1 hypothetical protein [Aliiroseovarius sp. xm-v-201]NRQ21138.1 hypothetical protein [Aliiroseovarius sp. xm-v-204]NRQ26358.1 hypothetical protein [Aliiroseovarius sp. xm-g-7]